LSACINDGYTVRSLCDFFCSVSQDNDRRLRAKLDGDELNDDEEIGSSDVCGSFQVQLWWRNLIGVSRVNCGAKCDIRRLSFRVSVSVARPAVRERRVRKITESRYTFFPCTVRVLQLGLQYPCN
jgi:hypothetical protein